VTDHSEPLIPYDREMHLDLFDPVAVGDTFPVVRWDGPREGDRMGTATVTGFFEDGSRPPRSSLRGPRLTARIGLPARSHLPSASP
jgi:hypothetical protein